MPSGLELARVFYDEAVAPIVANVLPGRRYTAGLIGPCSDVIGFDDEISRDHGWGPRCHILLDPEDFDAARVALDTALANRLPLQVRGYPTSYDGPHMRAVAVDRPPIRHWVEICTPRQILRGTLGVDDIATMSAIDWLSIHEHRLLTATAGALFRDDLDFQATRDRLAFYPDDIRLHVIAVEWQKLADELAFPGRAGSRGDELGSAIIAARFAESVMRLCFYIERVYPPYSKWFGSAFRRLAAYADLHEPLADMLAARDWQARDRFWTSALRATIAIHERAGLLERSKYQPAAVYLGRPGTGLPAFERGGPPSIETLIDELRAQIRDDHVRALRLGSINQLSTCSELTDDLRRRSAVAALYSERDR